MSTVLYIKEKITKSLLIHSTRVTVAAIIAALAGIHLNAGHMYWLMFTVVLVLQGELGSSIKRSFERIGGTLVGAPIGIALVILIGTSGMEITGILLAFVLIVVVLMMKKSYGIAVVFITIAVLLGYSLLGTPSITGTAAQRIFDTSIGTVIAVAVSIIIFPNSLNVIVISEWRDFLKQSGDMYERLMEEFVNNRQMPTSMPERQKYIKSAETLIKHANESAWELGILGANSVQKDLRNTMVRTPMLLINRYLEMSTLPCNSIVINENIKTSLLKIGERFKTAFYTFAQHIDKKQEVPPVDVESLRTQLDDEIYTIVSELKTLIPDREKRWDEIVKLSAFYEQSLGVLEVLQNIKDGSPQKNRKNRIISLKFNH